jgi:hypothetical protein
VYLYWERARLRFDAVSVSTGVGAEDGRQREVFWKHCRINSLHTQPPWTLVSKDHQMGCRHPWTNNLQQLWYISIKRDCSLCCVRLQIFGTLNYWQLYFR